MSIVHDLLWRFVDHARDHDEDDTLALWIAHQGWSEDEWSILEPLLKDQDMALYKNVMMFKTIKETT